MFTRRWDYFSFLLIWLMMLGLLLLIATAKRNSWGEAKAATLAHQLRNLYSGGYGNSVYLRVTRPKAEYLIFNRGVLTPELAEELLTQEGMHCEQYQPRAAVIENWPLQDAVLDGCREQIAKKQYLQGMAGYICFRAGDYDRAFDYWRDCIAQDSWSSPVFNEAYFDLLTYYGRESEVDELLSAKLREYPESGYFYLPYARWLVDGGRYEEAVSLLRGAKSTYVRTYVDYWQCLGESYLRLGRIAEYKQLLLEEIAESDLTGTHGKPTLTADWWGDWQDRSEDLSNIKGLNDKQRLLFNLDPHLAIIEGFNNVALLYYGSISSEWSNVFKITHQPEVLKLLEDNYAAECASFLDYHTSINEPMVNPDLVGSKDWRALDLLGCYVEISAWDKARELDGQFNVPDNYLVGAERQRARLLCTLASGGDVSQLNLRRLLEGGELPKLLRSRQFNELLKQGGYDRDTVLAQIREASKPWRMGEPNVHSRKH